MADLCEKVGANVKEVSHAIGLDGRIGPRFLQPGPGFGGSCFPKDTLALVRIAQEAGAPSRLVEAVVAVNDARKAAMSARVIAACGGSVRGKTIAILGLTFKPDTDDMRDSPSLPIVARLIEDGAVVRVFDPQGMEQARPMLPGGTVYCDSAEAAVAGADAAVLVTEWEAFRTLDPEALRRQMGGNVVVDLRNVFDPAAMQATGFRYHGIGTTPR
jgi:UDPglucose 6-dehydrogenase